MKRNDWMALIATTILMFAVCLSASAKGKRTARHRMYSSHTQLHPSTMEDVILMAEWITAIVSMMLPSPNYIIR